MRDQSRSTGSDAKASTAPTTTVVTTGTMDSLPLEFLDLPETGLDEPNPVLVSSFVCISQGVPKKYSYRGRILGEFKYRNYTWDNGFMGHGTTARERLRHRLRNEANHPPSTNDAGRTQSNVVDAEPVHLSKNHDMSHGAQVGQNTVMPLVVKSNLDMQKETNQIDHPICFATHDAFGVLDLGASKTVIGSNHVACLIRSLDEEVRAKLSRCPCQITFKFGNQGTLTSQQALVVPVGKLRLKIAIVPGGTPFLISNTFMRAIRAQIDCCAQRLISPQLNHQVPLELTPRGLFLVNLNDIIKAAEADQGARTLSTKLVQETFVTAPDEKPEASHLPSASESVGQATSHVTHMPGRKNLDQMVSSATEVKGPALERDVKSTDISEIPVQSSTHQVTFDREDSCHGLADQPPEEPSGGDPSGTPRPQCPDVSTTGKGESQLRSEAHGGHVREGLGRSAVDQFHGVQVRFEQGVDTPPSDPLRRAQGGGTRTGSKGHSSDATPRFPSWIYRRDKRSFWQQIHPAQSESSTGSPVRSIHWPSRSCGGRRGTGVRDVQHGDYGPSTTEPGSGFSSCTATVVEHGRGAHQGDSPPGGQSCGSEPAIGSPDAELIAHDCNSTHQDVGDLQKLIRQFSKEIDNISKTHRPMGKPYMLGEVFCSRESPLTQQVQNLGSQAFRHGMEQGDLATTAGRAALFQNLCRHAPKHLWYSPVCGPWSSWSALNASRSLEHQARYQQVRHEHRYQIALGIVLYRHQISKGLHFHWEQPQRSLMMLHPGLTELHQHTQCCQFDMCKAGDLKDPKTHHHMKKGMQILTTHEPTFRALHGLTCTGEHVHQPIEGSINHQGCNMLRSQYTEVYPRKFARLVAKTWNHAQHTWPFRWQYGMLLAEKAQEVPVLAGKASSVIKSRAFRSRTNFVKSQLLTPVDNREGSAKRRRLDGKQSSPVDLEVCQNLFHDLQNLLPRVGRREIQDSDMLQKLQQVFPDKNIVTAIACRGTDRTMGPPEHLQKEVAPYRRTIMILRPSGSIQYEKEWEKWDNLSNRQLIRPAHACRINCTVFAQDRPEENESRNHQSSDNTNNPDNLNNPDNFNNPSHINNPLELDREDISEMPSNPSEQPSRSDSRALPVENRQSMQPHPDTPASSEPAPQDSEICPDATTKMVPDLSHEISRKDQSSQFQALPKWEQTQLLQMHRNLGHPSNERLAKALQANGQRPEMVRAAAELKCSVCAAHAAPKHQRPSHLKELLDFNYRVYLDGIKWTNRAGESFQLYHIVDAGTHFHVAFVAPAHTSKDVISLIHQHWINWAGSPQELKVDSGTELNSEEFLQFAQRMSIKCITTCPEAHWQNGTIERHGSFLQHMLSKIDLDMPIKNYRDLQMALNQCTQAKNAMVIHRGYSPEIMVFGKQSRLPGSVLSDASIPAHTAALQEESDLTTESFRQQLKIRELARQAFHMADNSDALRRSFLRRSCPSRGHYHQGQWVMIWRTIGLQRKGWIGPQRVIVQDGNHTIWTTVGESCTGVHLKTLD